MFEITGWELQELINIRPEGVALEGSEAILNIKSPWAGLNRRFLNKLPTQRVYLPVGQRRLPMLETQAKCIPSFYSEIRELPLGEWSRIWKRQNRIVLQGQRPQS
jgi:hypothetical protein